MGMDDTQIQERLETISGNRNEESLVNKPNPFSAEQAADRNKQKFELE